ncbi:unnamed protein product [Fraxinus pennsylvanica]|uniref:F-box domain-containing protein n=1 Tax=Fraxinus pennsylvanica TaxID=56036 RepID=A0AAD2E7W1_9LAMI|nr:unnamed protein product [Fraxinus pennsylvanica]
MQNSSLPEDVIVVILSRLPVKALLRFKCVCTRWRSLISSSFFASLHLDRSIANPARHSLLVHELRRRNKHMSLDLLTSSPNENLNLGLDRAYTFGPELIYAGSINGLICMLGNSADSLLIWNPSSRMFKTLPLGRHTDPSCLSIGFGWDTISDDYKVVKIGSNYEDGKLRRTWSEVWSANLDSWSEVEIDQNFGLLKNSCDVIVKGFAYWFAEDGFESDRISLIASFDMRTEVLKLVPVPDSLVGPQNDFDCMNWKETFALIERISSEPRKIYQCKWKICTEKA